MACMNRMQGDDESGLRRIATAIKSVRGSSHGTNTASIHAV
jgi:hypothetical protein